MANTACQGKAPISPSLDQESSSIRTFEVKSLVALKQVLRNNSAAYCKDQIVQIEEPGDLDAGICRGLCP